MEKLLRLCFLILLSGLTNYGQAQVGSMRWVAIPNGTTIGSCSSSTDCGANTVCMVLEYTPSETGILTSYTTGFFIDCFGGANVVSSNTSCVMVDNSDAMEACASFNLVLINSSGNGGSTSYTQNIPVNIHQVCFSIPPGGSVNITEDETTNLTANIDLTGGGSVTDFPSYTAFVFDKNAECATLPVELISFDAFLTSDEAVMLEWSTATEQNNQYFEVQYSTNGENFSALTFQAGSGNSTTIQHYSYLHERPIVGDNYYRIKQVDFDGSFTYYPIEVVKIKRLNDYLVYPSQAIEFIHFELFKQNHHDLEISIFNTIGVNEQTKILRGNESKMSFDVSNLAAGVYFIGYQDSKKLFHISKFIKID